MIDENESDEIRKEPEIVSDNNRNSLSYLETDAKIRLFLEYIFYSEFSSQKKNEDLEIQSLQLLHNFKPEDMYTLKQDKEGNSTIYGWVLLKDRITDTNNIEKIEDELSRTKDVDFNYNSMLDLYPKPDSTKSNERQSQEVKDVHNKTDVSRYACLYQIKTKDLICLFEFQNNSSSSSNERTPTIDSKGSEKNIYYCLKGPISLLSKSQEGRSQVSGKTTDVAQQASSQKQEKNEIKSLKEYTSFDNGHWFFFRQKYGVGNPCVLPVALVKFRTRITTTDNNNNNQIQTEELNPRITEIGDDPPVVQRGISPLRDGSGGEIGSLFVPRTCQKPDCCNVVELYCETCQKFLCMKCGYEESIYNETKTGGIDHKVLLLEREYNQIDSDIQSLEKRIENLKVIIEQEKSSYKVLLDQLKQRSSDTSQKFTDNHKKVFDAIAKEERKRLKELAMLGSNVIRINIDLKKKVEYINHLKKNESTSSYISAVIIYQNYINAELGKNILCLEKKILDYNLKYIKSVKIEKENNMSNISNSSISSGNK